MLGDSLGLCLPEVSSLVFNQTRWDSPASTVPLLPNGDGVQQPVVEQPHGKSYDLQTMR